MPLLETEAIISQYLKFCFFVKMQFKSWVLREVLLLLWRAYLISLLYSLRIGLKCLPGMWETQVQSLGWAASNAAPPKEGGITAQVHQSLAPALSWSPSDVSH